MRIIANTDRFFVYVVRNANGLRLVEYRQRMTTGRKTRYAQGVRPFWEGGTKAYHPQPRLTARFFLLLVIIPKSLGFLT